MYAFIKNHGRIHHSCGDAGPWIPQTARKCWNNLGFHSTTSTNHHGFPWVFPSIHWKHGGLTTSESTARVGPWCGWVPWFSHWEWDGVVQMLNRDLRIFYEITDSSWSRLLLTVGRFQKAVFFFGSWPSWPLDSKTRDGTKEVYQSCRLPCFWLIQQNSAEGQSFATQCLGILVSSQNS